MIGGKRVVRSLKEDLQEVGIDPSRFIGDMDRATKAIDARARGWNGGGPPEALRRPLQEAGGAGGVTSVSVVAASRSALGTGGGTLDEALKAVKKKRKTASQRLKAKRSYRKVKAKKRLASRKYYARKGRKILRRAKMKLAKFGRAGLARLHKARKRIVMMSADSPIANLREDLNGSSTTPNPYEEAAFSAGLLSVYLGEIFEVIGDKASATTMYELSDVAAAISEEFDALGESEPSEAQAERLQKVLETVTKAIKMYESMGSPSLFEAIEVFEAKNGDEDEDEDDEDEDEDEEDEEDEDKEGE